MIPFGFLLASAAAFYAPPAPGDPPANPGLPRKRDPYNRPFLGAGYPLADADFQLKVEVQEALEGGPLVLEVTLTNVGKEARRIVQGEYDYFHSSDVSADAPQEWAYESTLYTGARFLHPDPVITLNPGDTITQTLRLHMLFHHIRSGKASFPVYWRVCEPLTGRASEVLQLIHYTIPSQALRIFLRGDTDVCSCFHTVH